MSSWNWTPETLIPLRQAVDTEADHALVAAMGPTTEAGEIEQLNQWLASFVHNKDAVPDDLPSGTAAFLKEAIDEHTRRYKKPEMRQAAIRAAAFFEERGPEIVLFYFCYGLPACYCTWRGAQVLAKTGGFGGDERDDADEDSRVMNRVVETAQLVLDVATPTGLDPDAEDSFAMNTGLRVRLVHAAVRRLILEFSRWDAAKFGKPLNELDMLGTLMAFSIAPTIAMHKWGLPPDDEGEQAWLDVWNMVGELMGVRADLLPRTVADAIIAWNVVVDLQSEDDPDGFTPRAQGRDLCHDLIRFLQDRVLKGRLYDGMPAAIMRFLLTTQQAEWLDIHSGFMSDLAVEAVAKLGRRKEEHQTGLGGKVDKALDALFRAFLDDLVNVERHGDNRAFRVPETIGRPTHGTGAAYTKLTVTVLDADELVDEGDRADPDDPDLH